MLDLDHRYYSSFRTKLSYLCLDSTSVDAHCDTHLPSLTVREDFISLSHQFEDPVSFLHIIRILVWMPLESQLAIPVVEWGGIN